MLFLEKTARTVDAAIEECLAEMNLTMEQVDVEILSRGSVSSSPRVRVTQKQTMEDKAVSFVDELLDKMGLECRSAVIIGHDGQKYVNISGRDNGIAIGYRGEVLDAMQYITLLAVNGKNEADFTKISLDAENYREKRTITLADLAQKLAQKAIRTGRPVDLEPMNPFERRVVHTALQDNTEVHTESSGMEPNRHISIIPVNARSDRRDYGSNMSYGTTNNFRRNGPSKGNRSFGAKKR